MRTPCQTKCLSARFRRPHQSLGYDAQQNKEKCLECLQVLGGNGYSQDFHVERLVRDAKLLEIGEGTNEVLRMVIGGTVLASN